jgi:hypothetical protein
MSHALASQLATMPVAAEPPRDFAFWTGDWEVAHRQLKRRLVGETEWITFAGSCSARQLLGGFANMDENEIRKPTDTYIGMTVRMFDQAKRLWSIYWLDSRFPGVEPPVVGSFANGIGTFYGDDVLDGRKIRVRFLWTTTNPDAPRWEQAFSADDGESWETNWIMDFRRRS